MSQALKILSTRSQAGNLAVQDALSNQDVSLETLDLFKLSKIEDNTKFHERLEHITSFSWVIFTSSYSIQFFFEEVRDLQINRSQLRHLKFACIGEKTALTLLKYGYTTSFTPKRATAEELVQELINEQIITTKDKVLLPQSELARDIITNKLNSANISCCSLAIYQNKAVLYSSDFITEMFQKEFDWILFFSPSAVRYFYELVERYSLYELVTRTKFATIGSVTANAIIEHRGQVELIATEANIDTMCQEILQIKNSTREV